MTEPNAVLAKHLADQQSAMAVVRVGLAADQRESMGLAAVQ
jgi:hypothetical protein